jgi:hypothetical protein
MTVAVPSANRAPHPSGLADVLEVVLDKGIVIDAYVRVSLVGIELLTIDARVVIASVDTYLHFAEAVNRLDIGPQQEPQGLPGILGNLQESGAQHKTKGALSGVTESAKEFADSVRGRIDDNGHDKQRRSRDDERRGSRSRDDDGRGSRRPATATRRRSRSED